MRIMALIAAVLLLSSCSGSGAAPPAKQSAPAMSGGPRTVTLLHIADEHAQLETHPEYMPGESPDIQPMGGFARLRTAIDRQRASAQGPSFLLDGGDTFQGSGPAAWSKGQVVLAPLNALGIDAFVPGNWDPVYGPARFKELMHSIQCPVICYNFHDTATNQRLFPPEVTLEKDGIRVTFVGITDPHASERQSPAEFIGMDTSRTKGLREFVRDVRARERADLVVAVTHTGLEYSRMMARQIPEFDVVLSGHTHERTYAPILEGKVLVVEPGSMASFLGRLDLTLAPAGQHGITGYRFRLIPIRAADFPEDAHVAQLVNAVLGPYPKHGSIIDRAEKTRAYRQRMSDVVGQTHTTMQRYDVIESNADNLITDIVRETAHADVAFSNGFRFSPPVPSGPITEGDLWNLMPLEVHLKIGTVTGQQLRDYLEHELAGVFSHNVETQSGGWGPRFSGMTLLFTAGAADGHRVQSVQVGGKDLDPAANYLMASCEPEGAAPDVLCRLHGAHDTRVLPMTLHQALDAYFQAHPVVAPTREGRSRATDLAGRVFSQDQTVLPARPSVADPIPAGPGVGETLFKP